MATWRTIACTALLLSIAPWGASAAEGGGLFSADAGAVSLRQPVRDLFDHGAHPEAALSRDAFPELSGAAELRIRVAHIDLERLLAVRLDIEEERSARLNLNLFADAEFEAAMERTAPTAAGYTMTGRLAGVPTSTVVLAVNGDAVAGKVWSQGAVYTIRSTGGGAVIWEVDPSVLPRCEGPATPPNAFEIATGRTESSAEEPSGLDDGAPLGATVVPKAAVQAGGSSVPADDGDVIDLLVVYPPFVRRAEGGVAAMRTLIDRDVAATNEAYRAGGVAQRVRLVAATEVDYGITSGIQKALHALAGESDGEMDEVHALRDSYAADLVLLHLGEKRGVTHKGGIAYLLIRQSSEIGALDGFSVSSSWAFAHELGHNMGLGHHWTAESGHPVLYPYGRGYEFRDESQEDEPDVWTTIMHSAGSNINRFSNPNQRYPDESGVPLGVPGDDWPETDSPDAEGPADAVRALNNIRRIVANFRASAGRCAYALSPAPSELLAEGGEFKVRVRTVPNCPWTARSHDGFVSVAKEGTSGFGDGEVTYRVQRNEGWRREAALLVAGETYPLRQVGGREPTPVCERTAEVALRISEALNKPCEEVTTADLSFIGVLPVATRTDASPKLRVTALKPEDFEGLSNLTVLRISAEGDLTLVPGLFEGLPNLRKLYLSGNHVVEEIPLGVFRGLSNLDYLGLGLDGHPGVPVTLDSGVFKDLSNLRSLAIGNNFTLRPGLFTGLSKLRLLYVKTNRQTLPPGVFAGLSDLVKLRFLSEAPVLRTGTFQGLTNLRHLDMRGRITVFGPHITSLSQLTLIEPGAFDGLRNVESLFLHRNRLSRLDPGTFEGLSSLSWLTLDHNHLKTLSLGAFSGLSRLESLWLQGNGLRTIEAGAFDGLHNLWYLNLKENDLTTVPPDLLHGLFNLEQTGETAKLEILHLQNNLLTQLPPNLLRKPAKAGAGDEISYETTDGRFWRMMNLTSLHLFGNRLMDLPADIFRSAPFLGASGAYYLSQHRALDLTGNPGAPFVLPLEIARLPAADSAVGRPLQVTVKVANGAPFPLAIELSASGGRLSDSEMVIARGDDQGVPVSVTPNGEGPVTLRLETVDWAGRSGVTHPEFPGLEIVPQRSPLVLYGYADARLELGDAAVLDLPSVFSYFVGDAAYTVESSDPTVVAADVEGNALRVNANAAGAATVTVTATGRDGRRTERRFKVTVEEPLGGRWSGWRSVLLQQKPDEMDGG